jgi:hypothetical protein
VCTASRITAWKSVRAFEEGVAGGDPDLQRQFVSPGDFQERPGFHRARTSTRRSIRTTTRELQANVAADAYAVVLCSEEAANAAGDLLFAATESDDASAEWRGHRHGDSLAALNLS